MVKNSNTAEKTWVRISNLAVGKDPSHGDHSTQNDPGVEIIIRGLLVCTRLSKKFMCLLFKNTLHVQHLNAKGDEAEDGARPEEQGEAGEEALAEFDPFRGGGRGGQLVQAVLGDPFPHLISSNKTLKPNRFENLVVSETVCDIGREPFAELLNAHLDSSMSIRN